MELGHSGTLYFPEFKKFRPTKGAAEKRQNRENVATLARKELLTKITWGGARRITLRTLVFPVKFDSYARDGICNMMQDILAGAGIMAQ